jgi:hypothetical protein
MDPLVNKIRRAFEFVKAPADHEILGGPAYDPGEGKHLQGFKRWQEVPPAAITSSYADLALLSPKAFAFFLPAFMVWTIQNQPTSDLPVGDYAAYLLNAGPLQDKLRVNKLSRFAGFSKDQVVIITEFLERMASDETLGDGHAAQKALDHYWTHARAKMLGHGS